MPASRDRRARLAVSAVFAVQGLTFATLLTQVAALQRRHALGDGELAILLLAVPVIAGLGSVLAGELARRYGSRPVLRAAQPLAAVAVVLAGLAPGVPALVAANVLFGLCLGAVDAGMNMQAVAVERRYGRPVLTGFHAVWSAAAVLGAGWASVAGGLGLDLPATFAAAMVPAAVVAGIAAPVLYRTADEHVPPAGDAGEHLATTGGGPEVPRSPYDPADQARSGRRMPWRPILPLCLAMAFLYVGDASISNFGSVYLEKELHAGAALVPWALGAYQAATFLVRVGGDRAVRRFGPAAIVRAGGALAALGLAGVVAAPDATLAVAAFGLAGVGLSVVAPQSFSAAGRLDPARAAVAVARVNMFNYVGFVAGAALVGGIADPAGYRVAFAAPLLLAAAIIVLAGGFRPRVPAPSPAPVRTEPA
ncbi:MFS transporter [Sphaerisporangium rufum]|uniref:MFS transporter n=1 Tax=Sphaerisporangium rufum TaxID=1381558 RepID=A0A919R2C1_9ACTN|nr:MFS transporter [Sphaerisporangium rufum]GII77768.1 MFS transporter [Sphaerisporangium rufum]